MGLVYNVTQHMTFVAIVFSNICQEMQSSSQKWFLICCNCHTINDSMAFSLEMNRQLGASYPHVKLIFFQPAEDCVYP